MVSGAARRRRRREKLAAETCAGKQTYLSMTVAGNAAVLLGLRFPTGPPLSPYQCPVCADFHLTSRPTL